jgi:co-chaperonin GroES (HSP10)
MSTTLKVGDCVLYSGWSAKITKLERGTFTIFFDGVVKPEGAEGLEGPQDNNIMIGVSKSSLTPIVCESIDAAAAASTTRVKAAVSEKLRKAQEERKTLAKTFQIGQKVYWKEYEGHYGRDDLHHAIKEGTLVKFNEDWSKATIKLDNDSHRDIAVSALRHQSPVIHGDETRPAGQKRASKSPQPSAERVNNSNGRSCVVYVGPRGGRYIKKDGIFVRLQSKE